MSVVLVFGLLASSASSTAGLAYTCTDGSFDLTNIQQDACFSFLEQKDDEPCPPCDPAPAHPVSCQYIDVKQTTSNTFVLSDISVTGGETGITNLVQNMTPPVGVSDSKLIDAEEGTDAQETSSFTLDLAAVRDVLSVTLTNTADTTRQADVCGTKIILRRPLYQGEASDSTDVELEESPIIDYVADSYTYTVGGTSWQ